MQPSVRAQYNDAVRAAVAEAAGTSAEAMRDLGGFESFVHEADVDGSARIVKATWGGRRSAEEMGAELHFVDYLATAGAPACRPLPLSTRHLLETVQSADGVFHVTAWTKAPGAPLPREKFTPEVFRRWGELAGLFHRLSAAYAGPPPPCRRPTWREDLGTLTEYAGETPELRARFETLLDRVGEVPRSPESFGPMHTDLHRGNIHWHEGAMHVFDFEDMLDFWFISDLAIILFYAVVAPDRDLDRQALYDAFAPALWEGYAREHELPSEQREALPLFMALREQTLRAAVLRSVPAAERGTRWKTYLSEAEERLRTGAPALGLTL